MKKKLNQVVQCNCCKKKLIMELKIVALLIIAGVSNLVAIPTYSQFEKISLDMKNIKLVNVMDEIENKSEFYFLFNQRQIDVEKSVSINVDSTRIEDVLSQLFEGTGINYVFLDRQILLTTESLEPVQKLIDEKTALQQLQVSGKVTDASTGEPMPGVNILLKGTTVGALTDVSGNYALSISDPQNAILVFSFIGFVTQEIPIGNNRVINISLSEELLGLEEVVVIGYGTAKKLTLTGSVSAVDSKVLNTISSDNLVKELAGTLPGLRVVQKTGQPGSFETQFDIRGLGTPLIVINGIVSEVSDFVRLNPTDIEQISILKDASAAVYGVKAANGVLLVTTRRGAIGKPKITFTGTSTLSNYINFPKPADAYVYAWALTQSEMNKGRDKNSTTYSPEDLQKFKDGTYPSTDWFDVVTRKYATSSKFDLSIVGGSDRITYFSSIGYIREQGIWKSDDLNYQRYNIRSTVVGKITDNLEAELNIMGMLDGRNMSANDGDIVEAV